MDKEEQSVTGKCCEDIGLFVSPQRLEISYQIFLRGAKAHSSTDPIYSCSSYNDNVVNAYEDIHLIYPMLEYIKQDYIHPDGNTKQDRVVFHYRCRHHCQKTGKCLIHTIKPRMCLSYPVNVCHYEGCSCPGDKRDYLPARKAADIYEPPTEDLEKLEENMCEPEQAILNV
jgi:hypothetical protein